MFRRWFSGGLAVAVMVVCCTGTLKVATADTLDDIKARGKMIIGVKSDFPPFGYVDANGKKLGFDVDIARLFAKALLGDESKVELVAVSSANRIPFLQSNKIDMIIASLTITDERKKLVDFSEPYFLSGGLLLVLKHSAITCVPDLHGKVVGVLQGSVTVKDMEELASSSERVRFDKVDEALFALKVGQTDAFANDDILMLTLANADKELKTVGDPFFPRPYGIAVRKGETEFVNWVNQQLSALRADGTYDLLWKKYFGEVKTKLMRLKNTPSASQNPPVNMPSGRPALQPKVPPKL